MSKAWPTVRLGEVLTPVRREASVDPLGEYRLLGVRLDGNGPFLRETVTGSQTAATKLFRVAEGDFIYSRLFACRGALGVIEEKLDGCYVSGEFPTFTPISNRVDVQFLRYWFRLPAVIARVDADCSGSTPLTRNRFNERYFVALEIPLPSLAEQRRVVARIEELAEQIQEAHALREQITKDAIDVLVGMAHRRDLDDSAKATAGWKRMPLRACIHVVDDFHRVAVDGSYPNLGIYSFGRGLFRKPPIEGGATSATMLRRVKAGQFIYSRLFAFEGSYGIVTPEYDGSYVSAEYPTFECNTDLVWIEFLEAYFKAPSVWKEVAVGSKGLGDRRQRVQPEQILGHTAWIPPIASQTQLAKVRTELNALDGLQAEATAELDALLPAILDRAFKGELV